jgi:hypothetical protein
VSMHISRLARFDPDVIHTLFSVIYLMTVPSSAVLLRHGNVSLHAQKARQSAEITRPPNC